ncbi:MAG: T9SS type A sorting domain-containing protein, partial [Bacteroidota bacterium]|nr:T9SS type A sorting domain-containing protein [Bacteroidota bacterium]
LAAAMLASAAWAQTTVTLTVDMTNEMVSMDGVHVAGNFQGWDPAATPMTDNGDGTWSHTFTSDTAASYQYKFVNGNAWGTDEGVPAACAVDGNRGITVDGMMGDVSAEACFGNCAACGMTTVRFRVDMANEEVSPFGVHVAGSFNAWSFDGLELLDDDGDMVYEVIYSWDAGTDTSIVYKFVNGNSTADLLESVEGDCSDPAEPQFGNRYLALDASDIVVSANVSGSPYCFNSCGSCVAPLAVTFNIDMSVVASVSENGVHLAGSFQGWEPAGTPMMDNGDGTWSVTVEMEPGTYEFKFINSNAWDGNEENMEGTGCNAGGNRIASFDADNSTYTACFNTCPGESCVPDPDPADVTFRVNAANQELMEGDTLFLWGSFTGWQGGAIAMTDADADGIWEHTETISGGANVDYKYSIGHPNSEGMIEEDGVFILDGDTTNFEAAGCGAGNGFGGFNRRHVRSSVAEVLDVVCFNECSDCEGSDASVYDATVIFGLFPNPATDRVVLTGAQGNADVFVLDVQGREVMSLNNAPLNGRFELNVAGLEAGAYTVVIRQGLRQGAQRILVH